MEFLFNLASNISRAVKQITMATSPRIIFGTAGIARLSQDDCHEVLRILEQHGVKELDTAKIYTESEATIGKLEEAKKFTIHTKAVGFREGALSRASVLASIEESLTDLGLPSVDVYFLHAPDDTTPIEETLSVVDELYRQGKFKRFGLSNFSAAQVEQVHSLAASKGWVLPTVYQGNYNAFARHIENDLFPVLRKLNMAFFAYSPLAGGFFAKDPEALSAGLASGRFGKGASVGQMYNHMYNKPSLVAALKDWGKIAGAAGLTATELAYRWITYHSALDYQKGDALIVGASSPAQLEETLVSLERGPLSSETAAHASSLWAAVKDDAPVDNFHSFLKVVKPSA